MGLRFTLLEINTPDHVLCALIIYYPVVAQATHGLGAYSINRQLDSPPMRIYVRKQPNKWADKAFRLETYVNASNGVAISPPPRRPMVPCPGMSKTQSRLTPRLF